MVLVAVPGEVCDGCEDQLLDVEEIWDRAMSGRTPGER
jgi:hypothetical protein